MEKPKPPTGRIEREGYFNHPSKCSYGWFTDVMVVVVLLTLAMMFGFMIGLRVGIAHVENRIERSK